MINTTDLYFITRYCDSKTGNVSKAWFDIDQIEWRWDESYYTYENIYLLRFTVILYVDHIVINLQVYKSFLDNNKMLREYELDNREIDYASFKNTLDSVRCSGKEYIEELEKCN